MKLDRRKIIAVSICISGLVFMSLVFALGHAIRGGTEFQPSNVPTTAKVIAFMMLFSVGVLSGLAMVWYYYPELRERNSKQQISRDASPLEVILFVSTTDETRVIHAIQALKNRAYKFEISRLTGLSRMKVHRIVTRLAEREIVRILKEGRHVRVFLEEWLVKPIN